MKTILNQGEVKVRVAGRYLEPGEQCEVSEDTALTITTNNPDVVIVALTTEEPKKPEPKKAKDGKEVA